MTFNPTQLNLLLKDIVKLYDLTDSESKRLLERLSTFSLKIRQPRKDDRSCNKTPYFDRCDVNSRTSYLTNEDPRFASKEGCNQILAKLIALLSEANELSLDKTDFDVKLFESALGRKIVPNSLKCVNTGEEITKTDIKKSLKYATQRLGGFEIPIGYKKELNEGGLHNIANVGWMKPFHINYKLRELLKKEFILAGGTSKSAKNALDKIQVKAYCTDKFTMPPFFSNRDIRWATWPKSNQYCSHYCSCMIELELMCQIFEFSGAPKLSTEIRQEIEKKRGKPVLEDSRRCYILGKKMTFKDYLDGAILPQGGKSSYHVSHMLPLTRGGKHHYTNIEWISSDGNRIQGNDTLQEIEQKLIDSVSYYVERTNTFSPSTENKLSTLGNLITSRLQKKV